MSRALAGTLGGVVAELRRRGAKEVIWAKRTLKERMRSLPLWAWKNGKADFDRPETLETAFRGLERLPLVRHHAPGVGVKQYRAAVRAAKNAGVEKAL